VKKKVEKNAEKLFPFQQRSSLVSCWPWQTKTWISFRFICVFLSLSLLLSLVPSLISLHSPFVSCPFSYLSSLFFCLSFLSLLCCLFFLLSSLLFARLSSPSSYFIYLVFFLSISSLYSLFTLFIYSSSLFSLLYYLFSRLSSLISFSFYLFFLLSLLFILSLIFFPFLLFYFSLFLNFTSLP
jgi:hypothetical protein